jgi:hypothetical protein
MAMLLLSSFIPSYGGLMQREGIAKNHGNEMREIEAVSRYQVLKLQYAKYFFPILRYHGTIHKIIIF